MKPKPSEGKRMMTSRLDLNQYNKQMHNEQQGKKNTLLMGIGIGGFSEVGFDAFMVKFATWLK